MAKQTPTEGVWFPWILTIIQALVFAIGGWTINRISELEAAQDTSQKDLLRHEQALSHPGTEAEFVHLREQLARIERKLDSLADKEVKHAVSSFDPAR